MPRVIDYWFDYSCPYAYLGSTQVEELARRVGAELRWRPMLLGGVFEANGTPQNPAQTVLPPKASHNAADMARWAALYGVELRVPEGHPLRTVQALRATLATRCDPHVIHGLYEAYWVRGRLTSDDGTLREVLSAAGHDAAGILARSAESDLKEELRRQTNEAIALGIFGAPSYVVDGNVFWGQDRAHFATGLPFEEILPAGPVRASALRQRSFELYWDFSSPFAYLASTQAERLAARTGATLLWRPMLLGGLFKAIGQSTVPLQTWSAAKQRYTLLDMQRWAAYWKVPFSFPSRFPTSSLKALRWYLAVGEDRRGAFRTAAFRACWAEDRDIGDDTVLRDLCAACGDDPERVSVAAQHADVKQALTAATDGAARAGVFGAPTWVVEGGELFWGQDRIPLVERALLA